MITPHELFRETLATNNRDFIAAIKAIREQFGMNLRQAKEVMLQVEGTATSLDEHEERLAFALESFPGCAKRDPGLMDATPPG